MGEAVQTIPDVGISVSGAPPLQHDKDPDHRHFGLLRLRFDRPRRLPDVVPLVPRVRPTRHRATQSALAGSPRPWGCSGVARSDLFAQPSCRRTRRLWSATRRWATTSAFNVVAACTVASADLLANDGSVRVAATAVPGRTPASVTRYWLINGVVHVQGHVASSSTGLAVFLVTSGPKCRWGCLSSSAERSAIRIAVSYERIEFDINTYQPLALFIGSSNATPGTWVEAFVDRMGWTGRNYSIGGGSFSGSGSGTFQAQLANAIADTAYNPADVEYFFICDLSNDIRANASIFTLAKDYFTAVTAAFPNAKIVLLPAVWGNATLNNTSAALQSIGLRVAEVTNASRGFDVDIIPESWLWLADNGNWMESTAGGASGVHPNPAGYRRVADFMVDHMRGHDTSYNQGFKLVSPRGAVNVNASYWYAGRDGNLASLQGVFELSAPIGIDTELGQLDYGLWPMSTPYIPVVSAATRQVSGTVVIFKNGLIRSLSGIASGTHSIHHTWRAF